jgi:hypothetical protein
MTETKKDEHKTGHDEKHHLEKMTVHELREIVKAEIPEETGVTGMKKEHLVEIIKKHRGIEDDKPVKHKAGKVALTVDEIKHKIIKFKTDKKAAIEAHDKKRTTILRRRISRFKKRIRKAEKKAA